MCIYVILGYFQTKSCCFDGEIIFLISMAVLDFVKSVLLLC